MTKPLLLKFAGSKFFRKSQICLSILLALLVFTNRVASQQPTPTPVPDEEVLTVDTNLVQVEAIVKDKKGNIVTGLKAEDFEIVEDGRSHTLDFCTFVTATNQRETVNLPDKRLTQAALRRSFVFIINNPLIDLGYIISGAWGSTSGTASFRKRAVVDSETASKFLNKFVENQMGDRDIVSLVDTEVDLGTLSSFTNDRTILRAAISQARSNFEKYPVTRLMYTRGNGINISQLVQQNLSMLGIAQSAVSQLEKLPGRKFIVLLSRSILFNSNAPEAQIVKEKVNQLIAQANKAQVTFYLLSPGDLDERAGSGVLTLAEKTGGRAIYGTNDVSIGFEEVLKENDGYYLLAYDPGEAAMSQSHQITVRLKNPDLRVQTRSTAYKSEKASENLSANEKMLRILRSPLGTEGLGIAIAPAYEPLEKNKGSIKTYVVIDPRALKPEMLPNSIRLVKLDLGMQVIGPDNKLVRQEIKNFSLRLSEESWDTVQKRGLLYQFETKVDKPGYHQVNVAACLESMKKCGSASRFINTQIKK